MSGRLEREIRRQVLEGYERMLPVQDLMPVEMAQKFGVQQSPVGTTILRPSRERRAGWWQMAVAAAIVMLILLPTVIWLSNGTGNVGSVPPTTVTSLPPGMFYNPANGHHYEIVVEPGGLDWETAASDAENRIFRGQPGHLATIGSGEEDRFIRSLGVFDHGLWIGGFQSEGSSEPDGGWQWITGEPFEYTNWGEVEPNDDGDEACIEVTPDGWNDFPCIAGSDVTYIVEYDTTTG